MLGEPCQWVAHFPLLDRAGAPACGSMATVPLKSSRHVPQNLSHEQQLAREAE